MAALRGSKSDARAAVFDFISGKFGGFSENNCAFPGNNERF
jgi:hypothetical protein